MIQETSKEAYKYHALPNLGHKQELVLSRIYIGQSMTNAEIARELNWPINTVTPRVYELREKGLVVEDEKRLCRVTGKRAIAWRVVFKSTLF